MPYPLYLVLFFSWHVKIALEICIHIILPHFSLTHTLTHTFALDLKETGWRRRESEGAKI